MDKVWKKRYMEMGPEELARRQAKNKERIDAETNEGKLSESYKKKYNIDNPMHFAAVIRHGEEANKFLNT